MECVASMDVLRVRCLISPTHYEHGVVLVERIVSMLTKMITNPH